MIPQIQEIGFGPGTAKSYATLHQATVSLQEMGERGISTQVRIDGDVVPDFSGWELEFKGERFILPTAVPQAAKDNTTRNSLIDLNFTSWIILELKRYYFMSLSQIDAGTAIADKYKASIILPLKQFVELFNRVLNYYFGNTVRMDLFQPDTYSTTPIAVDIDYTHIWDVLLKLYDLSNVRWTIAVENGVYVIKVGYAADSIDDHDFEYGYEGGLVRFERQVQDESITNVLLGRGGENNIPYRYFKQQDPQNPEWEPDPDAVPELANIYFDRLRDAAFRWYVRGWMQNPNRDTSWDATHTFPTYSDIPEEYQYAYDRGRTDEKFNPVEFAKDDDSIAKYGERWGALEDNDKIFPTIQGVVRDPIGRVDEVVAVSEIITDDIRAASENAAVETNVRGATLSLSLPTNTEHSDLRYVDFLIRGKGSFTVPEGKIGYFDKSGEWALTFNSYTATPPWAPREYTFELSEEQKNYLSTAIFVDTTRAEVRVYSKQTNEEVSSASIPAGAYYYKLYIYLNINMDMILNATAWGIPLFYLPTLQLNITAGTGGMLLVSSVPNTDEWKPTFDIWVKNIWETTQGQEESDETYAARVWEKILGDRVGNEAKIVFSDGFMSISEDYEFQIASYPVVDRSRTFTDSDGHTYQSEWKITLRKSDAEFGATGLFIPNASASGKPQAGDHFFFIGIDMPFQYVEWAEEHIHASKLESLQGTSDINPTWVINLDKVRVHTIEEADYGTALADRLAAGATVWIKDRRFTSGERLRLFVQSITYTWNEPSDGSPYLVPDIEVVLSDKVNAPEGVVQKLQGSVDVIHSTYAKTSDLEAVVRSVTTPLFLKKTGEDDSSESPTTFSSKVSSKNFRQGDIGGAGWGLYKDGDDESVLELDKIVVRHEMRVNNLVSNQISYVGGKQITSAASIECTQVVDALEGFYCYFDQKQGTVANLFVVGDFAMVQNFDPENVEQRHFRARVDEVGLNYILLSKTVTDNTSEPKEGDTIIQYGNESVAARQYVIIRDVIGGGYERMLSDLDSVNAAGKEYYFAGRVSGQSPRWFVGDSLGEYAEWEDGALTVKGRIIVRNSAGQYKQMENYLATVDYLQAAMPEDEQAAVTTIAGGVVLSKIIGVESSGNLVAGLNASSLGSDNTHGTLMIFAGAADAASVSAAKFRVYADGHVVANDLYATGADISGKITSESGEIGGFKIAYDGLKNGDDGDESLAIPRSFIRLYNSHIQIEHKTYYPTDNEDLQILIGEYPTGTTGEMIASRIFLDRGDSSAVVRQLRNYGVYLDITGEKVYNYAIFAKGGMYGGLRLASRILYNDTSLSNDPITNVFRIANKRTITLPPTPQEGQLYIFVIRDGMILRSVVDGVGKQILTSDNRLLDAAEVTSGHGVLFTIFDNKHWLTSYMASTF